VADDFLLLICECLDGAERLPDQASDAGMTFLAQGGNLVHRPLCGKFDATVFVPLHIDEPKRVPMDVNASKQRVL
jgi:hypothetical protein